MGTSDDGGSAAATAAGCGLPGPAEAEPVDRTGRIALAPARFGRELVGGAEIVMRQLAYGLRDRGWSVEVLTTCAVDHFTWVNELAPGVSEEDGLTVRRFPAVFQNTAERADHEGAILSGRPLSIEAQQRWMNSGMRSPELYHHLLDHSGDYRALLFGPYLFWVAFACSQLQPERSMLWTCLHDEPYAYLDLFRPVLSGVAGLLFQSGPEHDLAHRILPALAPHAEVGCGVEVAGRYDPDGFRQRYNIPGRFVLYAGRREGAKGWDELLAAFAAATQRGSLPFSLVTMGAGPVNAPAEIADRIVDVGFLPDAERDNAFAAADAYLQPSRYEAFSRTIMEAWLAGTPVIGNAASEVVAWHCRRSGAGLVYDDQYELEQCLRVIAEAPDTGRELARPGRDYVLSHYTWPAVLDKVERALQAWVPSPIASLASAASPAGDPAWPGVRQRQAG